MEAKGVNKVYVVNLNDVFGDLGRGVPMCDFSIIQQIKNNPNPPTLAQTLSNLNIPKNTLANFGDLLCKADGTFTNFQSRDGVQLHSIFQGDNINQVISVFRDYGTEHNIKKLQSYLLGRLGKIPVTQSKFFDQMWLLPERFYAARGYKNALLLGPFHRVVSFCLTMQSQAQAQTPLSEWFLYQIIAFLNTMVQEIGEIEPVGTENHRFIQQTFGRLMMSFNYNQFMFIPLDLTLFRETSDIDKELVHSFMSEVKIR